MKQRITIILIGLALLANLSTVRATVAAKPITDPDPRTVKAAIAEFNNLSKKEKKAKFRELKNELKHFKAAKKAGKEPSTNTVLLVIVAILLPPLAVYLHEGEINSKFWIDLLLTLLFYLPGLIYALVIILRKEQ